VTAAVEGTTVVGVALAGPIDELGRRDLLALGVAPAFRRQGLATALLEACVASGDAEHTAGITLAERDPIEPLDRAFRGSIARRLRERAGFEIRLSDADLRRADPGAFNALRPARSTP
jgi:GNAT superfamily N-acetyltransferase